MVVLEAIAVYTIVKKRDVIKVKFSGVKNNIFDKVDGVKSKVGFRVE